MKQNNPMEHHRPEDDLNGRFEELQQDILRYAKGDKTYEELTSYQGQHAADTSMPQLEVAEEFLRSLDEEPQPEEQPLSEEPVQEYVSKKKTSAKPKLSPQQIKKKRKHRKNMLITNRVNAVIRGGLIGTIALGISAFLLVGVRPTESAEENRTLAEFPQFSLSGVMDGSFSSDLKEWYEDTVPMRSTWKKWISKMESWFGLPDKEDSVAIYGNVTQVETETTPEPTTTPAVEVATPNQTELATELTTEETTTTTTEEVQDVKDVGDGIIMVNYRAISMYGGGFSKGEEYANLLNTYKSQLGSGVNVYSLVAPTAVSFYLPEEYQSYSASEKDNIDHIDEYLQNVTPVDAYSELAEHTGENIYARTDHHWLPLGAYYAAKAFSEVADFDFPDLSDYTEQTKSGYLGSMYTFTKSEELAEHTEDFTWYTPSNQYDTHYYDIDYTNEREGNLLINLDNVEPVSWYLVFMGGDEKITHVHTDSTSGRTLVEIKDSYGNALVPYLTHGFTDIYVIDMRYFTPNAISFIQNVGATDVLFAMNTFSATGQNAQCLETIRTQ